MLPDTLEPLEEHTYGIEFTPESGGSYQNYIKVEVNGWHIFKIQLIAQAEGETGVKTFDESLFTISPNPASALVTIKLPVIKTKDATLEIVNSLWHSDS